MYFFFFAFLSSYSFFFLYQFTLLVFLFFSVSRDSGEDKGRALELLGGEKIIMGDPPESDRYKILK